ncbi:MAG: hypothetical protein RLZZ417_2873 [Bacteroidota bacterium]
MEKETMRRNIVKSIFSLPFVGTLRLNNYHEEINVPTISNLKTSLNAYSFNEPLMNKTMNLNDLLEYCSELGFSGIDITGYYFPEYPKVPSDIFIFDLKRKAHLLGLSISGTGIRNDFTQPDKKLRELEVQRVKDWIHVAAKLGAPVIRIFSGVIHPKEFTWDEIAAWMARDIIECVEYGKQLGVIVALQNHNDFIKTAEDVHKIFKMVNREWFGLVLDIGSYRMGDPYEQIKDTLPYAVNWQIKESIYENGQEKKVDLSRIFKLINESEYKGFIPIETLGVGDPKLKVAAFKKEVDLALSLI